MKKKTIQLLFVLIFVFLSSNLFSLELWQGFTTEMSRDDIVNRVKELYGNDTDIRYNNGSGGRIYNFGIDDLIGYEIPIPDYAIIVRCTLPEYAQGFLDKGDDNIFFYFYKNKLTNIRIIWTSEDLLSRATNQFGRPQSIRYVQFDIQGTVYKWVSQGRDVFLNGRAMYYFDPELHINYVAERRRLEQERQAAEKERRRKATENVIF